MTMTSVVALENGRVRVSDDHLHRAACKGLFNADHEVFGALPGVIRQIIEHKTWRTFGHKDFASYALDATTNGLGVNSNQRLWILRCSMDVHGEHIKEWADVLAKVEILVKAIAKEEGKTVRSFTGNSLEMLAKSGVDTSTRITYMPSREVGSNALDGNLIRLRKNKPEIFKQVTSGELTIREARRAAGLVEAKQTNIGRAESAIRNMTKAERKQFFKWAREEGYLNDG